MTTKDSPLIPLQDCSDDYDVGYQTKFRSIFHEDNDVEFRHDRYSKAKSSSITLQKRTCACYGIIGILIALSLGIFIGRVTVTQPDVIAPKIENQSRTWSYDEDIRNLIWSEIKPANIRSNLQKLTEKPHIAGSVQDEEYLVNFIQKQWESYLDKVEVFPYDVLLSYPNSSNKNYVGIKYPNGTVIGKSNPIEAPLTDDEKAADVVQAFNAYSPAGHVTGEMFYVNYAQIDDFELLQNMGVNLTGGICICKYGRSFRGDKVTNALMFNCSALIIYSDPKDYAGTGKHGWDPESSSHFYPNTWWLPPSGFQRGSIVMGAGDPLTPNYPAINLTYRIPENEANMPKIPVQPISGLDAYRYLSMLNGSAAPDKWQGGFKFKYKIGGSFNAPHSDCKAELHVGNYREKRTIHTIIGSIRGWLEPDRYVLFGNHRDAWVFGGADPSSGTAVVMEVARAISSVVKSGKWRPRRTIVFCNWAAEEYGLVGSIEWTEQMEKRLLLRAVAYLNIDIAVEGNATFRALSTPEMHRLIYNVTKSVRNPNSAEIRQGNGFVYDTWLEKYPDRDHPNQPFIRNVGSGSDYTFFLQKAGVSSADFRYTYDKPRPSYPVYHSIHDTFNYFSNFLDRGFNCSHAIAAISADSLLQLSGLVVLPLYPFDYVDKLKSVAGKLEITHGKVLKEHDITLNELNRTISAFNASAFQLADVAMKLNSSSNEVRVREINDKLFLLNRGFLDFNGLPGRHYFRHVIFAPQSHNSYNSGGFPGVDDAIFAAQRGGSWENVKKQLSILCLQILSASELLKLE